jgi:hypothetical protein
MFIIMNIIIRNIAAADINISALIVLLHPVALWDLLHYFANIISLEPLVRLCPILLHNFYDVD